MNLWTRMNSNDAPLCECVATDCPTDGAALFFCYSNLEGMEMPATFTDDAVNRFLEMTNCDTEGTEEEKRERAARKSEEMNDHVQAWEIRTGRPWDTMTSEEARQLLNRLGERTRMAHALDALPPDSGADIRCCDGDAGDVDPAVVGERGSQTDERQTGTEIETT